MHVEYTHQHVMHELPQNSYTIIQKSRVSKIFLINKYLY